MKGSVVAAIDFGTTHSGFAYCKKEDYEAKIQDPPIQCHKWATASSSKILYKIPTCILFTPKKEFHSFGYDAMNFYYDKPTGKDLSNWYYFEYFKMMLYKEEDLTTETYLNESGKTEHSSTRKKMKAVDVFGAAIKFMKDTLMVNINKSTGNKISEADIHWIITVPAIWDLKAKQFMRDAATLKAEIPMDQITLALEPEAASIFCRRVPVGVETIGDGRKAIAAMCPGAKYIVLDQGGGTTDIAVHEVTGLCKLKEIHQACGGHWGGITVNENFVEFLEQLFCEDFIKHMKDKYTPEYFSFLRRFEDAKTCFRSEEEQNQQEFTTVLIPIVWKDELNARQNCSLADKVANSIFADEIKIKKDKFRMKNSFFRKFYDFSLSNVKRELETLLRKPQVKDVKTLLVVGGHSASTVLTNALKRAFQNLVVVVPKDPEITILKGAVLFGFEPETITSRVSRFTYGIGTTRAFHKGEDPENKKIMVDGEEKCTDVFDKHIEIEQVLEVGEDKFLPGKKYLPLYKDQKTVSFRFFDTLSKSPQYTTDKGCRHIGSLDFELTEGLKGNKKMILEINNSGTELVAIVTEVSTKKRTNGYFRLPTDEK